MYFPQRPSAIYDVRVLIELDHASSTPLYEQVAAAIRREIAEGALRGGDELPSARTLAGALGINLHTVLRALRVLRDEGILDIHHGRTARVVAGASGDQALFHQALGAAAAHVRRLGLSAEDAARYLTQAYGT